MNPIVPELIAEHSKLQLANANEAQTRLKLIDRILFEVLGWFHEDVNVEERVSEDGNIEFLDYVVRTANTAFIIEAKRIGASFLDVPSTRKAKLSGKIMKGETGAAIRQARDYCRGKSVPFAVVTNGTQWIIFPAIRTDQIEFSKSSAIVFGSLESALSEEHDYFISLLSRDGVINGHLNTELLGRNEDQLDARRLGTFFRNNGIRPQNPIFPLIESAVTVAFSDTVSEADPDLLEKCYVKSADRTKFDGRIKMHLSKRDPLFGSKPTRPMRKRDSHKLAQSLEKYKSSKRPIAILVLGSVGVGKTTFLKYTRHVSAGEFFRKHKEKIYPHWIDIDFRQFSINESPIDFIYEKIFDYIIQDDFLSNYNLSIKEAYREEIEALRKGPMFLVAQDENSFDKKITEILMSDYSEKKPYVDKLIKSAAQRTTVFLTIDNVDQFENEEKQSEIFSDSIALAQRLGVNVAIAMRESTYVKHRHSPTFDAFDFDPIQIEPPEIRAVLSRRFFIAKNLLTRKSGEFTALNGAIFKVDDLSVFMELSQQSVLSTEIGNRIEVLANSDVRLALRITREFLTRGYTDPAKALRKYRSDGHYTMPRHEAFRSILLGNQPVYAEQFSIIGNPFDSRLGKTKCQLLRIFVLSALVQTSTAGSSEYIDGHAIRQNLEKLGYSDDLTLKVLSDLCELRFINTSSHHSATFDSNFYPTRLGGHVIRELIGDVEYVENVLMDTFIADESSWSNLRSLSQTIRQERNPVTKLKHRVKRLREFYSYLRSMYKPLVEEARRRGLSSEWCSDCVYDGNLQLAVNMRKATSSARRNYGKDGKGG